MIFDFETSSNDRNAEKPQNETPNLLLRNAGHSVILKPYFIPGNSPHMGHKASHSVQEIGTGMFKPFPSRKPRVYQENFTTSGFDYQTISPIFPFADLFPAFWCLIWAVCRIPECISKMIPPSDQCCKNALRWMFKEPVIDNK